MVVQGLQSPRHSLHDTVMCELDMASFTSGRQAEAAGVPAEHRGKYLGLLDRLDHIRWAALSYQNNNNKKVVYRCFSRSLGTY